MLTAFLTDSFSVGFLTPHLPRDGAARSGIVSFTSSTKTSPHRWLQANLTWQFLSGDFLRLQ